MKFISNEQIKKALDLRASTVDKAKLFPSIHALIGFSAVIVGFLHLGDGSSQHLVIVQLIIASIFFASSYFYKNSERFHWSFLLLPFIAAAIHIPYKFISYGTILNPAPIYLIMAPLMATFIFGGKIGSFLNAFFVLELLVASIFIKNGSPYVTIEIGYLIAVFLTMSICQVFMSIYESSRINWKIMIEQLHNKDLSFSNISTMSQISGNLAHNLNNPLTIILGNVNKLKHLLNSEQTNSMLNKIEDSAKRVQKTAQFLIELSSNEINNSVHELLPLLKTFESYSIEQVQIKNFILINEVDIKAMNFYGNRNTIFKILTLFYNFFDHQQLVDSNLDLLIEVEKKPEDLIIIFKVKLPEYALKIDHKNEKFILNKNIITAMANSFSSKITIENDSTNFFATISLNRA